MAKKPDGKPASTERVSFTRPAAERIGKAVRQVEAGDRDLGPIQWGPRGGGAAGKVFRVCTFTGAWSINTSKTVTFRNVTTTPNTVAAVNAIISLPAPSGTTTSRIVNIAKDGTQWHLVSFQMSSKTAVFATAAQTVTVLGTAATQQLTFAVPGSAVSVITGISASISTTDCTIVFNRQTASVSTVGTTQTVTTISAAATQTATVMAGPTFTATYISLEL